MNDNGQQNEFSDELISAYLDGELQGDELDRVSKWLQSSTEAQQTLTELQTLRSSLHSLPRNQLDADFGARVQRLAEKTMLQSPASSNQESNSGQEIRVDRPADQVISPRKDSPVARGDRGWYRGAAWGAAAVAAALVMALLLPDREPTANVAMQSPADVEERSVAEPGDQMEEFVEADIDHSSRGHDSRARPAKESSLLARESGASAGPPAGENNETSPLTAAARDKVGHDDNVGIDPVEGFGDAGVDGRPASRRSGSGGERLDAAKQMPRPLEQALNRAGNLAAPSSSADAVASPGNVDGLAAATAPSAEVPLPVSVDGEFNGGGFAVKLYSNTDQRQELADEVFADADPPLAGGEAVAKDLLAMANLPGPPDFVVTLDAVSGVDVESELTRNLQAQNISLRELPGHAFFRSQGIQDRGGASESDVEAIEPGLGGKPKGGQNSSENRALARDDASVASDDAVDALTEDPVEEAEEAQRFEAKRDLIPLQQLADVIAFNCTELIYVEALRSQIDAMLAEMDVQAEPYSGAALSDWSRLGTTTSTGQLRKRLRESEPDSDAPDDDYEKSEFAAEGESSRQPNAAPVVVDDQPGIDDKRAATVRVLFVLRTAIPQAGTASLEEEQERAAEILSESDE